MKTRLASVALLLFMALGAAHADTLTGRVVGVTDGDTITVLDANRQQHKIRLGGIDAPEKAQPFGQRSKENLSRLVFNKEVQVDWTKRDRYQRIVGKVWVQPSDCPTCPMTLDSENIISRLRVATRPSSRLIRRQKAVSDISLPVSRH